MLALFRELDQMIQEVEALSNVLRSTLHRVPIQCSRKENHVQDTHELYQAMTSLQLKMKTVCTLLRSSGCASEVSHPRIVVTYVYIDMKLFNSR